MARLSCSAMSGPGVMISTSEDSAKVRIVARGGMKLGMVASAGITASLHALACLTIGSRSSRRAKARKTGVPRSQENEQRHQENRPLLFGRARYLHHAQVAAGALRRRHHYLHGGPGAGRGARAGAQE